MQGAQCVFVQRRHKEKRVRHVEFVVRAPGHHEKLVVAVAADDFPQHDPTVFQKVSLVGEGVAGRQWLFRHRG